MIGITYAAWTIINATHGIGMAPGRGLVGNGYSNAVFLKMAVLTHFLSMTYERCGVPSVDAERR